MIPDHVPVFEKSDILNPSLNEYKIKNKCTVSGWLKYLFLFPPEDGDYYVAPSKQDRKDYTEALKKFREVNSVHKSEEIEEWEEDKSIAKSVEALNKWRIAMGYTEERNR